ncbi:MAG: right-handed parallel beta-helix repeat-containing protein [Planctomycetes bacterium]|nr:right-handed parallel beta-helix repeat-containing protein [Planctomycetota bacterium]
MSIPRFRFGRLVPAVALLLAGLAATPGGAQVIRVPRDQLTLRAALAAAKPGTTIQVAPGTYQENLVWPATDGICLVSEAGPTRTVLDAGRRGRVITFGAGLTRATRLEGFTLVDGLDREGAGLYLGSSITVRGNRILGCTGLDSVLSRGAGIFVAAGTSPRIEQNDLIANSLDSGKTARGAGIFVADGAYPEILGNRIVGNLCRSRELAFGGGIHVGLTGTPAPLLASNVIASNRVNGTLEARGGGIHVEGGTALLVANTLADNECLSLAHALGGGLHMGKTAAAGSRVHGNIVARNRVSAALWFGGGIYCEGTPPALDFNDVWQNTGGDYFGCAPGLNDFARDPMFLGPLDYHLSPYSPCVDAGANSFVPPAVAIDAEGDPRMLDGNLDGGLGNGATVDCGADELSLVRLAAAGPAYVGGSTTFQVSGPAVGASYALLASTLSSVSFLPPFGTVLLGSPAQVVAAGTAPASPNVPIPFQNALAGLAVHLQAIVALSQGGQTVGQLTNRLDLTLQYRFDRPIVEVFVDQTQLDRSGTTAGWTRAGQPGLHATAGFAGSGADGELRLVDVRLLDSSTRQPGPDSVVTWDFTALEIGPQATLRLKGPHPIRLNVTGEAVIEGTVDASGWSGLSAPSGTAIQVGRIPGGAGGPGAGAGGDSNLFPNTTIGALPMELRGGPGWPRVLVQCGDPNRSDNRLITVVEPNCGGGTGGNRGLPSGTLLRDGCCGNGGGHATSGVETDYLCSNIGAFGREYGRSWIIPTGTNQVTTLTAGTGGGAGGNAAISTSNPIPSQDIVAGSGGGGGGGLEIVTGGTLRLRTGARLLAIGGNGGKGHSTVASATTVSGGWGGGGSGGSIWLSGTSVTVETGATIDARRGVGNPHPLQPNRNGNGGDGYVIIRDLSGSPVVQSTAITPAPISGRGQFAPVGAGKSAACSLWYGAGGQNIAWAFNASNPATGQVIPGSDLQFLSPPAAGQTVFIAFQGAPDVNGQPDPNPARWYPPGNTTQNPNAAFTSDIAQLNGKNLRYVRFRIQFDLGALVPPPNPIVIGRLQINY